MWRILVLLTGSLGLFLVLFLIIYIGISVSKWQAWVFGGACGLLFYLIAKVCSSDKVRRERRRRKAAKRRAKLERIKKAQSLKPC